MKPGVGKYQAAMQVKVLSPVKFNVEEVDSFHLLEDSTICTAIVRDRLFLRGLSPWHDTARRHQEPGRTMSFPERSFQQAGEVRRKYGGMVVGLNHSRGVVGVMPDVFIKAGTLEDGSAAMCKGMNQRMPYVERWRHRRLRN